MKSIKQQYIDLQEGKMSQANFMRNVRMTLPQYITNVTSFNDTVKILKNKGILSESHPGFSMDPEKNIPADTSNWDVVNPVEQEGYDAFQMEDGKNPYPPQSEEAGLWMKGWVKAQREDFGEDYEDDDDAETQAMIDKYGQEKAGEEAVMGQYDLEENPDDNISAIDRMYNSDDWVQAQRDELGIADEYDEDGNLINEIKNRITADKAHPQELKMGIKVEMEHTDDPKKAEKIALDHLTENPFYYTQLKLSGVDTQAKPSKEKKAIAKKKDETELVDKANQMKPVKGVEKPKKDAKAHKETNKPVAGISLMSLVAKTVRGVKKMDATGEKMKIVQKKSLSEVKFNNFPDEEPNEVAKAAAQFIDSNPVLKQYSNNFELQNGNGIAILKYNYWEALPDDVFNKLELQFEVDKDVEEHDDRMPTIAYLLTPKRNQQAKDLGASFNKFKSTLEEIIKEELKEYFDGRDNLTDVTGEND